MVQEYLCRLALQTFEDTYRPNDEADLNHENNRYGR
jgi:hypothetical protein